MADSTTQTNNVPAPSPQSGDTPDPPASPTATPADEKDAAVTSGSTKDTAVTPDPEGSQDAVRDDDRASNEELEQLRAYRNNTQIIMNPEGKSDEELLEAAERILEFEYGDQLSAHDRRLMAREAVLGETPDVTMQPQEPEATVPEDTTSDTTPEQERIDRLEQEVQMLRAERQQSNTRNVTHHYEQLKSKVLSEPRFQKLIKSKPEGEREEFTKFLTAQLDLSARNALAEESKKGMPLDIALLDGTMGKVSDYVFRGFGAGIGDANPLGRTPETGTRGSELRLEKPAPVSPEKAEGSDPASKVDDFISGKLIEKLSGSPDGDSKA